MRNVFIVAMVIAMCLSSCDEKESNIDCGSLAIIDQDAYEAVSANSWESIAIKSAEISGDCLTLILGYSGCNDGHRMELISNGEIFESNPPQIHFKIRDNDPQLCLAYFTETFTYDLTPVKSLLGDEESVRIIFTGKDVEVTLQN